MATQVTAADPTERQAGRGAITGSWKYTTYADPTPPRSLGVSPAHLRGSYPPGKAPVKARPANIPIVVPDSTDEWATWGSAREIPGWQRLGDTVTDDNPEYAELGDQPPGSTTTGSPGRKAPPGPPLRLPTRLGMDAHNAYAATSGASIEAASIEGNYWRSQDRGAVAGRAAGPSYAQFDPNDTVATTYAKAGPAPSLTVARGGNGLALNNPEGQPGHDTPRVQRFPSWRRRFGNPLRTHNTHTLRQRTPWAWADIPPLANDPFGSPFDRGTTLVSTGTTVPERLSTPQQWDQVALDMPLNAGVATEDDGGDFGGGF
jgi:hypothetical protein